MKKIIYFVLFLVSFFQTRTLFALNKEDIIPYNATQTITSAQTGTSLLDSLLDFVRDSIFALMAVVAIGMFLFIGGRLIVARGNPEEFSKAMQSLIYAAVGIFLVAFSWAIVKLVAGLDI